jgi:hypothetical protein
MNDVYTPPSAWEVLIRAVVGFPKYILEWVIGLVVAILTDLHITTLAVTAILAGFYFSNPLLGVLIFFAIYSISRVASLTSNAVGFGAREIAGANSSIAGTISQVFQAQAQPQVVKVDEAD